LDYLASSNRFIITFAKKIFDLIARDLITDGILPLKTSDTGKTALSWMEDYKLSHLPIVNNEEFLGLISEMDIYELNNFDEPLGNHTLTLKNPYVYEYQHIFDVLKLVNSLRLTLIPVLDEKNNYTGSITLQTLLSKTAEFLSLDNQGGVIVLEMSINDYSLTEIANIVESNNAKILNTVVMNHPESTLIDVVLKLNTVELNSVIQTFERYNYLVKVILDEEFDKDELKERYNSLMKYLNV
jgi:predicted transcriptional regulator